MLQEGRTYTIITQSPQLALGILELDSPLIVGLEPNRSNNQKVRPTMTPSISPPTSDPDPAPQWIATREESGGWTLKNVANGKYLGVDGEPRVLARLIGVDSSTLWRIEREGEGTDSYWYC